MDNHRNRLQLRWRVTLTNRRFPLADPIRKLSSDQVAFVSDLTAVQDDMRHFCVSILVGDQGVEDVLQEANRVILEKADEFEIGTNFKAWAFSIVRFQAMAYCKRNQRESIISHQKQCARGSQSLVASSTKTPEFHGNTRNGLRFTVRQDIHERKR